MSRVVQVQPWRAAEDALLPVEPEAAGAVAAALDAHPVLGLAPVRCTVEAPGVNVDGCDIDVGDPGPPVVALSAGPPAAVLAACAALGSSVQPALLVVPDGDAGHLVRFADRRCAVTGVRSWRQELLRLTDPEFLAEVEAAAAPPAAAPTPESAPEPAPAFRHPSVDRAWEAAAVAEAGDPAGGWRALGPADLAVERWPLLAETLHRTGRTADAADMLRVALMADPGLLHPPPTMPWLVAPDLTWAREAGLAELIDAAVADGRRLAGIEDGDG